MTTKRNQPKRMSDPLGLLALGVQVGEAATAIQEQNVVITDLQDEMLRLRSIIRWVNDIGVTIPPMKVCPRCKGRGYKREAPCTRCRGIGGIEEKDGGGK